MSNLILPVPFAESVYGQHCKPNHSRIIDVAGANDNQAAAMPVNLLRANCTVLAPLEYNSYPDKLEDPISYLDSNIDMAQKLQTRIANQFDWNNDKLCIIGGDHSVSAGTGAGLSKLTDMTKIGLIWVDGHSDFNTHLTTPSRSMTGCPCAINYGLGMSQFTDLYNGNFIQKIVQIGLREVDYRESQNLQNAKIKTYSVLDIEELGMARVMSETLDFLSDLDYIWLSIDIDSLDSSYFEKTETDDPLMGGLTPRELLYITNKVQGTNKLKVFELMQLNELNKTTQLTVLASRLIEMSFGLGKFRYNQT